MAWRCSSRAASLDTDWRCIRGGKCIKLKFKLQLDLHFPLGGLFPNTYVILRIRYVWSFCHLVAVIGIASASKSRTEKKKTLERGRFLEYLADQ